MRRTAPLFVLLILPALCAAPWKLVLKTGKTVECDGPPMIVSGKYLARETGGKDIAIPSADVDAEKTAQANRVSSQVQWRTAGESNPAATPSAAPAAVIKASDATFDSEVLHADGPVLVNFVTTWCPVCKETAPLVNAIAGEYTSKVKVVQIDAEASKRTARRYEVDSYPTLILFNKGNPVDRIEGGPSRAELVQFLKSR